MEVKLSFTSADNENLTEKTKIQLLSHRVRVTETKALRKLILRPSSGGQPPDIVVPWD